MSQHPLIDSSNQSSKTSRLKPPLAATLASLEVQLDQELSRYRRTRNGKIKPSSVSSKTFTSNQRQKFGATATLDKTQPAIYTNTTDKTNLALAIANTEKLTYHQVTSRESVKTKLPPPPPPNPVISRPTQANSSSIVPTKNYEQVNNNLFSPEETVVPPDDYLESSEALLRSLAQEQVQAKPSPIKDSGDSLLSPLGIGSMLLLLFASLTLGYVVLNPQSLSLMSLGNFFTNSTASSEENTDIVNNDTQPVVAPETTPIPKYPNLAAKEFPEVRDPNDIVGLKPKAQPTFTTSRTIPEGISLPLPSPTNLVTAPISTPASTDNTPNSITLPANLQPAADGYYHVVTDNQDEGALLAAREIVPDAYLSTDQKYIYLGALRTPEQVQRRLEQLQSRGIKARLKQP